VVRERPIKDLDVAELRRAVGAAPDHSS
jgi:hypothetical protein